MIKYSLLFLDFDILTDISFILEGNISLVSVLTRVMLHDAKLKVKIAERVRKNVYKTEIMDSFLTQKLVISVTNT